jgi:WD40 repeat protein
MKRGTLPALPLALVCLLLSACAPLATPEAPTSPPVGRIALSVLAHTVFLVDPRTGEQTELAGGMLDFQSGYGAWSPDRTRLAYADDGVYVRALETGIDAIIVQGELLSMPAWSPDGRSIAYGNGVALWIVPAAPGAAATQVRLPATLAPLDMDWHASGIAFEGLHRDCDRSFDCPSTDQSEIWIVNQDATGLRQVTHVGHVERPKWSPDGTQILFVRRTPGKLSEPRELWVVNADGSTPRRVVGTSGVVAADWSPDGSQIAMARVGTSAGMLQLWIARSDGSGAAPIGSPLPGVEATLDW